MIKQIVTKEEKEDFRQSIKEELMKVIVNVDEDDNLDSCYRLWLYNSKDGYFVSLKSHYGLWELKAFVKLNGINPIIIGDLLDLGRIYLNKNTSDEELDKFANKIIKEYNERVRERKYEEWYDKMLENGMIEEGDNGNEWHYTDKYFEKHKR